MKFRNATSKFKSQTTNFKSRIFHSPFSILHFPFFLALASSAIAADASNWRLDPVGWREDGGALESRSAGFAFAEATPAETLEFHARVTPRSCNADSYGTVGIAAFATTDDFWCLSLVKGPQHSGERHFCELGPMTGGQWPSYGLFKRVEEKRGAVWEWGRAYDLSIRFAADRVEGKVADAETGVIVYRTAFAPTERPLLPSSAIPALRVTGRFKARVEPTNDGDSAPDPPSLVTRHSSLVAGPESGSAAFPPYAPVGPETGLRGTATGFFHVESIGGIDWAVDPVGRAVPITGIDHVRSGGFSSEKLGYSPYGRFVATNYPSSAAWADETLSRLRTWGFDTLTAHFDLALLGHRGLAHAVCINMSDRFAFGDDEWLIAENLHAPCTGFPNVFHPDYERACEWAAETLCGPSRDDPWVVGWFIDNELAWWGRSPDRATGLFDLVMKKPDTHSAKKALLDYVAGRPVTRELKLGFLRLVAERYFAVTTAAIRKADPNHMILGCRFAGFNGAHEAVWKIAGKYCDVISFNCYPWADIDQGVVFTAKGGVPIVEEFRRRHALCNRPMIVTEWSFPALDTGRPCYHGAGQRFHTQAERTAATELFARTMLSEPYFIGYDYFMWLDQPATGLNHWFPEDSNYGLVQENGVPHKLITEMFARLHAGVAELRAAGAAASYESRVTSDESNDSSFRQSERERFFAEAAQELVARHSSLDTPSSAVFASENGGRWSLSNGLVRLSGRIGGAFMADEICFSKGGASSPSEPLASKPVGRFRALLQWLDGDKTFWTDTERVTDVTFDRDEATGIVTATLRAEGCAADTGMKTPAAGAGNKAPSSPLFAITARLSLAPDRPEILAEIVSVENLSATVLHVERVFMRPYAAEARPKQCESVPNLWKGPLEGWWQLSDGRRFGLSSRDDSLASISLWIKDNGVQHPDARFGSPFEIAPGETWHPADPMGALLLASPAGTRGALAAPSVGH